MAFTIHTTDGNTYTYLRHTNEIVEGEVDELPRHIIFKPRERITELPTLSVFTLGVTTRCNLRCTYCCYSGQYRNTRSHGSKSLTSADIEPILNFIAHNAAVRPITISFYGGECLLELPFIVECVACAQRRWPGEVKFEISTNGILLSNDVLEWTVSNDITLFISLDGSQQTNDAQRGRGSFGAVRRALEYLHTNHRTYFDNNVNLMMTVTDITRLPEIAQLWNDDALLASKPPFRISTVAPNYGQGVERADIDTETGKYMTILEAYDHHRDWQLLAVFFERMLSEWTDRPIVELDAPVEYPTCMPHNTKLYIDTDHAIGLCEKMPDTFRMGDVATGIDWNRADKMAATLAGIIGQRCASCPVARLCNVCPMLLDLDDNEIDIFCHNQQVLQHVKLRLFCELAERELI